MIKEELAKAIDVWMLEKPARRNLSLLARQSNVSYATIRRLALGKADPSFEVFVRIGSVVFTRQLLIEHCRQYFPEISNALDILILGDLALDTKQSYYYSNIHLAIIMLAKKANGTTVEEIQAMHGELGLAAIDDLLAAGILRLNGLKLFFEKNATSPDSQRMVCQQMRAMLSLKELNTDEENGSSFATVLSQGLTEDAYLQARRLIEDTNRRLAELVRKPINRGDIPWVAASFHACIGDESLLKADKIKVAQTGS